MFIDIWQWTPFVFLMMLAALASLPREPYEAAELDGANSWQQFKDLTWYFITPVVTIVILLRTMDAFRVFETMYIMTFGGPSGATESLTTYTYKIAFREYDMGFAAALSIAMLVLTIAFSWWFIRQMVRQKE
jgi:multiple sugar transport system permease protein